MAKLLIRNHPFKGAKSVLQPAGANLVPAAAAAGEAGGLRGEGLRPSGVSPHRGKMLISALNNPAVATVVAVTQERSAHGNASDCDAGVLMAVVGKPAAAAAGAASTGVAAAAPVAGAAKRNSTVEVMVASMAGTAIEFYDNYCYSVIKAIRLVPLYVG